MIVLRPLRVEDYVQCVEGGPQDWVDVEKTVRHGVAAWDGDQLVAVAGVLPYWPGVGEAWFALGPGHRPEHVIPGIRRIRNFLSLLLAPGGYRRIQADVLPPLGRWVKLLGFTFESEMPRYGPDGSTYHRYVRFSA